MNSYTDEGRHPCSAVIEGDWVVAAFRKDIIKHYTELNSSLGTYDEDGEFSKPKITNLDVFVQEVISALNSEDDEGGTLLTKALDAAILEAVENGADGIALD